MNTIIIISILLLLVNTRNINTQLISFASITQNSHECHFSDDDTQLWVTCYGGITYLYDIATGNQLKSFSGQHGSAPIYTITNIDQHDVLFTSSCYIPSGNVKTVIQKISDKTVLKTYNYAGLHIASSKNKEMVCVPDYNGYKIYIISTTTYLELKVIDSATTNLAYCEFLNNDTQIIVADGNIYNISDGQIANTINFDTSPPLFVVQPHPVTEEQFLGVYTSGLLEIRDLQNQIIASNNISSGVRSAQYSPDGNWVYAAGTGGSKGYLLCSQTLQEYYTYPVSHALFFGKFNNAGDRICQVGGTTYAAIFEAVCDITQYGNDSDLCVDCIHPCTECKSATYCLSCVDNILRTAPSCSCNDGYFEDTDNSCQPCHIKCKTCSGTYDNCDTCKDETVNSDNTAQCGCLNSYFLNTTGICEICITGEFVKDQVCQPCHDMCTSCETQFDNCTQCKDNINTVASDPDCNCKPTFYMNYDDYLCIPCQYPCLNCSSETNCESCVNTGVEYNTPPTCDCNLGYYFDDSNNQCLQCPLKCKECDKVSATNDICLGNSCSDESLLHPNCINIATGSFSVIIDGAVLEQTCDQKCQECETSANNCIVCNGSNRAVPDCDCKIGYKEQNGECLSESQIILSSQIKPEDCSEQQYFDDLEKKCQECLYLQNSCLSQCPILYEQQQEGSKLVCVQKQDQQAQIIIIIGAIFFVIVLLGLCFTILKSIKQTKIYNKIIQDTTSSNSLVKEGKKNSQELDNNKIQSSNDIINI